MGLACLIAVFEFIWKSRKLATEDNVRHSTLICKGFSHTSKHLFVINKQKSPKSSNPTNPPNNDTEGSACRPPVLLRQIKPSVVDYILELWIFSYVTLFENHPKCFILAFFINFFTIKIDLSGSTVWPQASDIQNCLFLAFFTKRLSTQNVNVARFARNIEWDFLYDFQTMWPSSTSKDFLLTKSRRSVFFTPLLAYNIRAN